LLAHLARLGVDLDMQRTGQARPDFRTFALKAAMGLLVAGALAGCATTRELPTSEARIATPADAVIIPPPGGPAIVKLVSTTYTNAVRQEISLATNARSAGENKITVTLFADEGSDGSDAGLQDIPFTNVNLTEEALEAWPGSGMAVSPFYVQNAYGPFGYAIGKPANGDTCIYAWQRIEPTLRPSGAVERGSIVIRLQLCRQRATEQELVQVMYQLRLDTEVFPPPPASPIIGMPNAPILPVGADGFAQVIPIAAPVSRPAAPAPVAAVRPVVTPPVGAPIVPAPGGTTSGGPTVPRPGGTTSGSGGVTVPPPPGAN
jgi:hypothetical protein